MAGSGSILGNAVQRLEDPTLLTGDGKYVDDLVETGMLHVAFVRSTGRPRRRSSRSTSATPTSMPGVVAVYHAGGDDLGLPSFQGFAMMPETFNRPVFADGQGALRRRRRRRGRGRVGGAGQRRRRDRDRRLRRRCRRSSTPPTGSPPDAPLLFPDTGSNICFASEFRQGAVDDPCEGADAVAEVTMVSQRLAGVPMENNGIVAVPERRRPHDVGLAPGAALGPRRVRADARASSPTQLRVVCPWVGGGFGPKAAGYVEHLVAGKAALALSKPGQVGRDPLRGHGVAGARARLRDDRPARRRTTTARSSGSTPPSLAAAGAYPAIGAILPMLTQMMSVGVYEIPKVRFDAKTVLTNNTTVGAYRGAGRPRRRS